MYKIYSKYRLVILSACFFVALIGYWLILKDTVFFESEIKGGVPVDVNPNSSSLRLLFSFYDGMSSIIPTILFFLLIPFVSHFATFTLKAEKVDQQIIIRTGWKKYLFQQIWRSVKEIWYLPVLVNGIIVLLIVFTVHFFPLYIPGLDYFSCYFYPDLIVDAVIFTAFQIVGWSILNLICLLLAEITTNKYFYPFLLLVTTLIMTFIVSFLAHLQFKHEWIFTALSPFNLFAPGVISLLGAPDAGARYLTVFVSLLLYGGVTVALLLAVMRRRKRYG